MNLQSVRRISSSVRSRSKSRRVATQAMWYVGAFYMTFLFATINRLVQQIVQETYFPLICFHAIFEPMQGLLNYLVYIRPRFLKLREQYPRAGPLQMLQMMVAVGRGDTIPAPDEHGSPLAPQPNQRQQSMLRVTDDYDDEEEARSELKLWRRVIKFASRARVPSGTSTTSNHENINNDVNNNSINSVNNNNSNNSLAQMDSHKEDMNHSASNPNDEGTRYPVSGGPQDTSSLELKALEVRLDDEIEELELLGSSFERRNRATRGNNNKNDLRLNSSNSSSQRARNWLSFGLLRETSFTRGEVTRNLARTQSHGAARPRRWSLVSFTESDRNMSNNAMATQAEAEEDYDDEEEEENDTVENIREGDNNHPVANGLLPSHEEFTDDEDIVDEDQDADQMASELREEAARPRDS